MTDPSDSTTPATKTVTNEIPPVTVAMIGTGTGDGGGVTSIPNGTILETPDGHPNIQANVVTPVVAILVRFVNVYLTTLVGLLTAGGLGNEVFGNIDFHSLLVKSAIGALSVAGIAAIKNVVTVFGRLEGKFPLATGSI